MISFPLFENYIELSGECMISFPLFENYIE